MTIAVVTNERQLASVTAQVRQSLKVTLNLSPSEADLQALVADLAGMNSHDDVMTHIRPVTTDMKGMSQFCGEVAKDQASVVYHFLCGMGVDHDQLTEATKDLVTLFSDEKWQKVSNFCKVMYLIRIEALDDLIAAVSQMTEHTQEQLHSWWDFDSEAEEEY
jgi:transcription elongation factor GreA-like protein